MSVNIKSLVEKLFHMSGSQAMPSTSEISVSASEGEGSFTAPSDGYLVLGASRKTSSDFAVVNIWNNINTCSASSDGYGQSRAYVPCKKGKTVQFSIIGNIDRSAFISTIGGGLNTILQAVGGGLCHLSHSFNRFSSSPAGKLTQTATCFKLMERLVAIPLRVMVLFCLVHHQSKDEVHLSMRGGQFPSQATARQNALPVLQFRARKVNLFNGHTAERLTFSLLPRQKARLSFSEGGAL